MSIGPPNPLLYDTIPELREIPIVNRSDAPCVLIVDDEEMVGRCLHRLLKSCNASWEILTACCGEEALQEFVRQDERVTVVVTDIRMPTMSGLELIDALRKIVKEPVAVIAISGCGSLSTVARFFRESDDLILTINFLEKPLEETQLINAIEEGFCRVNDKRTIASSTKKKSASLTEG